MKKILLAIDNYTELTQLHARLKKIGFDVKGIQSQRQLEEALFSFNPDVIVASTTEVKIYGLTLTSHVPKKKTGFPKIALLKYKNKSYSSEAFKDPKIDRIIEVSRDHFDVKEIKDIIASLAEFLGLQKERLLEKYDKICKKMDEEENQELSRKKDEEKENRHSEPAKGALSSTLDPQERRNRFQKFVDQRGDFKMESLSTNKIVNFVKEMRSQEKDEKLEKLDQKRMAFVKALFTP